MTYLVFRYVVPVVALFLAIVVAVTFVLTYWQWFLAGFVILALLALLSANLRKKENDVQL